MDSPAPKPVTHTRGPKLPWAVACLVLGVSVAAIAQTFWHDRSSAIAEQQQVLELQRLVTEQNKEILALQKVIRERETYIGELQHEISKLRAR